MLDTKDGNVRGDLALHWRQVVVAAAATALAAACTGGGEASPVQAQSTDSTGGGLAHVNGAALDSSPQPESLPASAVASDRDASSAEAAPRGQSNGSASAPERSGRESAPATIPATVPPIDTRRATVTPPARAPSPAGSAAVAPTPDELSALAASLVVPVAGVTPAELRGSFSAPRDAGARRHNALDIPAPRGTPVIAATPGRVLRLFNSKAGGLMIYTADATDRFILMYGHLDRYADGIKDGIPLQRGQTIGYVGTTGNAPPNVPHLHFAIARTNNISRWWNGTPVDPAPLLKR